jgi:hypothetical protein
MTMAQTEDALSFVDADVDISEDGAVWTPISGFTNSVAVEGGDRATSEFFTLDGDTPIVTKGKRGLINITVNALYTEEAGDPYEIVSDAVEANAPLWVRWAPKGTGSGNLRFTSSKGIIVSPVYPAGAADSADAIPLNFTVRVGAITKAAIAP